MSLTKQDLQDISGIVMDALESVVEPRFDALEGQVGKLEGRMDSLEGRMGGLEGRMDSLENRMSAQEVAQRETNNRLMHLERATASLESVVKDMDGRLKAAANDINSLYDMVDKRTKVNLKTRTFEKLSVEKKMLALYETLTDMAEQTHVKFPDKPKVIQRT